MDNRLENLEWMTVLENNMHALTLPKLPKEKPEIPKILDDNEKTIILKWLPKYLITFSGLVYSKKTNKFLNLHKNDNGYYRVYCMNKYHYVHRLVAEAWLGVPDSTNLQVNHKNMNRLDNRVENLEWITASENKEHSILNNPSQFKHLQKKVAQIDRNTEQILDTFSGIKEASRICKVNSGSIVKVM